jgi:hypothetical protein
MLQDDSLLTAVEAWHARWSASLANEGVTSTLRPKSTGRSKNSVSLDLEAAGRLGQAVVWDTGEAEIIRAELGQEPAIEIRAVTSAAQVEDLLNELLAIIISQ